MPKPERNLANSLLWNGGSLFDTISSGYPSIEKRSIRRSLNDQNDVLRTSQSHIWYWLLKHHMVGASGWYASYWNVLLCILYIERRKLIMQDILTNMQFLILLNFEGNSPFVRSLIAGNALPLKHK